ncbi:hypothetical protein BT96DRAFT_948203 [Gymnopus androsaceus JB14]|uniref:Uncharacterized protein n=1 Tax=Gymnopus androsaceus JB14 TaxID=1447944 RepID=A0A6A4GPD7_9AGAR|nr:hypothetical protein BT96DRAFT_948203 [Gymnopus androsaceus JB14]
MSNAEPSNTPPPQYTPAPATVPATRRKKGEATDIHLHVVDKEFEMKVKKSNPKFTGSKVIDMWRKMTSDAFLQLIKSGMPLFQNIALTEGQRKNNLNAITCIFQNHYQHKLKKANPRSGIVVSHEDAIKIFKSSLALFNGWLVDMFKSAFNNVEHSTWLGMSKNWLGAFNSALGIGAEA